MIVFLTIVLLSSLLWLLTVFLIYPWTVALLAKIRPRPIQKAEPVELPMVTFVMAAYNEERVIRRRIQNYQELDYPRERMRFIIGSDASSDRTDEIIQSMMEEDDSIELHRFDRSGKTKIVYTLAGTISEGIVIFSDADIVMDRLLLRRITECFEDPEVGGVVAHVFYEEEELNAGSLGERNYHSGEDKLRANESLLGSTIRPTGQCFAVRPDAYTPLTDFRMSDDLNLAITIALNGHRVWFEESARIVEVNRRNLTSETGRRLRMGQQSMASYLGYWGTRWPWRSTTGLKIWIGKLARNLAGVPALSFFVSSILLAALDGAPAFQIAAGFSLLWLLLVLLGAIGDRLGRSLRLFAFPLYFTVMVAALTIGSLRAFTQGGGLAMWSSPRLE